MSFRVVLDVNVIVGGFPAATGLLREVIDSWLEGGYELFVSDHILRATERAWQRPYWSARFSSEDRNQALRILQTQANFVETSDAVARIATHHGDDLILSIVFLAKADFLVTGDKELLALHAVDGIPILTVNQFLNILR